MNIYLTKKLRIETTDGVSFSPYVLMKNEEKNTERWKNLGYFASLERAVERIIEFKFFSLEVNLQLNTFIGTYKVFKEKFMEAIRIEIEKTKGNEEIV